VSRPNVVDMAHEILDMHEELLNLRRRCAHQEAELHKYYRADQAQLEMHQKTVGNILSALVNPDNVFNRGIKQEQTQ